MIHGIPLEFFVVFLFIVDGCLFVLLFLFSRRVGRLGALWKEDQSESDTLDLDAQAKEIGRGAAKEVTDLLKPLLMDAQESAGEFDTLIRDKKRIIKQVNEALDSRIISLNLLLSRADRLKLQMEEQQNKFLDAQSQPRFTHIPQSLPREADVLDQQKQIIDLYYKEADVDTIAERLSIPKGEVQLVIDLKEKFLAMEQVK